jgi:hypothetical protein
MIVNILGIHMKDFWMNNIYTGHREVQSRGCKNIPLPESVELYWSWCIRWCEGISWDQKGYECCWNQQWRTGIFSLGRFILWFLTIFSPMILQVQHWKVRSPRYFSVDCNFSDYLNQVVFNHSSFFFLKLPPLLRIWRNYISICAIELSIFLHCKNGDISCC